MPLRLVSREEWGAKQPTGTDPLFTPVPCVIIKYYTRSEPCVTEQECKKVLQNLQYHHQHERFYADIKYNFLIGGDGTVYEGRGWTTHATKHDLRFFDFYFRSIDIAYIGDFQNKEPPKAMVDAAKALIEYGVTSNFIEKDYELIENKKDTIMPFDPGFKEAYSDEHIFPYTGY